MAGNIKGIVVEIGGDTSGLQNALKKVNSSTSSLSKELRGINSLLKLDPKNTELVSQKQTVLKQNIEQTSKKLEELKKIQEAADKTIAEGGKISEENYRNLQREIINTENKLKQLKVEASKWTQAGRNIEEFGNKVTNISSKVDKLGTTLTTRLTLPIAGFATYAVKSFDEVDSGADIVIKKTGAVGDAAKELETVYKKVSGNVIGEFNDIGSAVGEINTRFEFTGDTLQEASEKFMKFAKINDIDVNTAIQKVSRYMGDASVESSKYGEVLDQLSAAAQVSGISIDTLTEYCTKYGAPMRALGLDTKESIAIFAGWEKAGVNTEIAFSGMKKAISNWGKAGKDSSKEFKKTLEEIKKAPNIAKATSKAIEVFGTKAGPDLADAIKGGRFEYEKFLNVLENSQETLENTYNGVIDEADDVQIAMKRMKVQVSEVGQEVLKTIVPTAQKVLDSVSKLISNYNKLDDKEKKQIKNMVLLAAVIGPTVKVLGTFGKGAGSATKAIGIFSQAVAVAKNNTTSAIPAVNNLASKIGFLTTPIGLATTAIGLLCAAYAAWYIADTKEKASLGGLREEVIKQKRTWEDLAKARQSMLSSAMSEININEKLAEELKQITDENGNVKQGYEDRAKTILGILNKALGTEYTMTGNVISNYKELQNEIDKTIATKKAEAVLNAYQDEYATAIREQSKATETLVGLKNKLAEAAEKIASGNAKERKEAEIQYSSIARQIGEQTQTISKYGKTISNINDLQKASAEGSAEAINKAISTIGTSYDTLKQKSEQSIEQQITNQAEYIKVLKESWQEAVNSNDTYQTEILKTQLDTQEQELNNLVNTLVQQTSTVKELTQPQLDAWKKLAEQSYSDYSNAVSKLPEPTRNAIQDATQVIALDTSLINEAGEKGNQATILFSERLGLSNETKAEINSAANEINNDQSVKNAASDLGQDVDDSYNKQIDAYTWGKDLCNLLAQGIWNFMTNPIGAAIGLANKIKDNLGFSLPKEGPLHTFDKSMPDMMELMAKGIKDNQYKVINSAENLATELFDILNDDVKIPTIQDLGKLQGRLSGQIIDSTKTIFTTPQIVFNVQELDEARLQQCFNYVNRKFGSAY